MGISYREAVGRWLPVPISHQLSGACAVDTDFLQDLHTSAWVKQLIKSN